MIVIVDYKMGNLGSILNMLKKIGAAAIISADPSVIGKAEKLILTGVGAFDNGMKNLDDLGFIPIIEEKVLHQKIPVLGICLGMQLMTQSSEEGKLPGLGWIDAKTVRFRHDPSEDLKVPHMGWNTVSVRKESALFKEMCLDPRFYFAHSFHAVCYNVKDVLAITQHGYDFVSAFQRNNIMGVQFHPEKSHTYGMRLLKNFAEF